MILRFSPVAGIQWVETQLTVADVWLPRRCFSPVAGIQWVETTDADDGVDTIAGFSPVAGIQWVETCDLTLHFEVFKFQSRCRDSVG